MLPAQQFGAAHTGGLAGAGSTSFRGCRGLTGCGLRCIPERLCPAPVATGAVVSRGAVGLVLWAQLARPMLLTTLGTIVKPF